MNSDDIIASMPAKCRDAWAEYEGGLLGGGLPRFRRAIATHAFKAAWEASIQSCAAFLAATDAVRPASHVPGPPARCSQPLATIPRDGRWVWVQRKVHPRVKQYVRRARWVKHKGPTGGRWHVSGTQTTMYDDIIVGWEPCE